ncbi:MAG: hypothetical protein ACI9WC_000094 [Arenicella sp.]|jgi:hypothetical protein
MNRRKLIQWAVPVIAAVALPAHGQTSFDDNQAVVPEGLRPIEPYEVPIEDPTQVPVPNNLWPCRTVGDINCRD